MKRKILTLFLAFLCLLSTVGLAGCGEKKSKSSRVYFLNFKPESASVYDAIAKDYEKETGNKIKVVTAAANSYEQTLKSEIAKTDAPTIFQINGPIGYESWKTYCMNLKDSRLYSFLADKSLAIEGSDDGVYGIPYVVEGYGIVCNKEIFDRYFALENRSSKVKDFDEITDFEALRSVTEDMTAHKADLKIEGVFASTGLSSGEDWRWQTHLLNVPLYYELKESEDYDDPTLATLNAKEIAFRYAQNYRNIFDLYINNSLTQKTLLGSKSTADSMAEFALGKVAMVQNGNWAWSQISDVSGNVVKEENVRFLPIYTGIEGEKGQGLCIGTENYLAVNDKASDEQKKASLDFLEWLFSSETGKKYVTEKLNFITPFNTFSEDDLPSDPLAKEISRYLNDDGVKNIPWIFAGFPSETFKNDVGSALLDYVQGNKTWDEVEKTAKDSWKREAK